MPKCNNSFLASIISIDAVTTSKNDKAFLLKFRSNNSGNIYKFYLVLEMFSTATLMASIFGFVNKNINDLWNQIENDAMYRKILVECFAENHYLITANNNFLVQAEKFKKRKIIEFSAAEVVIKSPKIRIILD